MTTATANDVLASAPAALAAVGQVLECSLAGLTEDQLLEVARIMERTRRMTEAFDSALIPELDARGLPARHVMRGPKQLLAALLNLSPTEAGMRVRHAHELGQRPQLTGELRDPMLPATAAARADSSLTGRQVEVIINAMTQLRASGVVSVTQLAEAEEFLVEQGQFLDAGALSGVARQLVDTRHPDGTLADQQRQQRLRSMSCVPIGDGMYRLTGDLDAEAGSLAMSVLHSLAAPKPAGTDGARDERSAGQRIHDAFRSILKLALRSGELPQSGGIPATLLITMTAEQFESGTGLATTRFGQKLRVADALRIAGEAHIAWVVHNSTGGILNHGRSQRVADRRQTLAMIARDKGCAFPGCTDPPEWTERHHVVPWSQGGNTGLDNMCPLCDFHDDRIDTHDWRIVMRVGLPWFIPPAWVDPEQKPRRNVVP